MKKLVLIFVALLPALMAIAQNNFEWPIKELDTARDANYLSEAEKDLILETNMVRYNPAMYAQQHMLWMEIYYNDKLLAIPGKKTYQTNEGKAAFLECIEALKKAEPAPILYPSRGMSRACKLLVLDQSSTGKTGHKGSGNTTPDDRMKRFGSFLGYFAENIHYGDTEPRFAIISLLIDDGVRNRGHRKTILSSDFNRIGVAMGDHKVYEGMCVINYATSFTEK